MPSLVVVAPGALFVQDGRWWGDAKLLSGMRMYATLFPGDVSLLGVAASAPDSVNLGATSAAVDDLNFTVSVVDDVPAELARRRHDVAVLPLAGDVGRLFGLSRRDVVAAEHTGGSRLSMALASPHSIVGRVRMEAGFRRLGRRLTALVAAAHGVQCNGAVAWQAYSPVSPMPVRVYDNRITPDTIELGAELRRPYVGGPVRLGFTGRLMSIKGPQYAVALPRLLESIGVEATLDVFGDGPDRDHLERLGGERVQFHGSVAFPDEWCRRVARGVDIMVLPHVQPDPSGSYLESAGVGVPVLGFAHAQMTSLVAEAGLGWAVAMRDQSELLHKTAELSMAPQDVERASSAGRNFMLAHHFENDFARRVEHLLDVLARS